ncbi:MAG: hypothetical protein P8Z30_01390 [Acidobacteriota bacterium]
MKHLFFHIGLSFAILLLMAPLCARAKEKDYLTSSEVDKLRDAQDPSERIKVYLSFEQDRIGQMEAAEESNGDVRVGLDELLEQYISIDNELKDWIQYQYDRDGDMRKGLRSLLDEGPKQLEVLRHIQSTLGPRRRDDSSSLHDAIADMNDTLSGATAALAAQQKKFPEMKENAKAQARALKKEQKEQEKLNKKERKLRNRHHKNENPDDSDDN